MFRIVIIGIVLVSLSMMIVVSASSIRPPPDPNAPPSSPYNNTPGTGTWGYTSFSACSLPCGGGTKTRNITCDTSLGACTGTAPSDKLVSPCQEQACAWMGSPWTSCTTPCSSGLQYRQVACTDGTSKGRNVADSYCDASTKPNVQMQCNMQVCSWGTSAYGDCSAQCGSGERKRTVHCSDGKGANLPMYICNAALGNSPVLLQSCATQDCPQSTPPTPAAPTDAAPTDDASNRSIDPIDAPTSPTSEPTVPPPRNTGPPNPIAMFVESVHSSADGYGNIAILACIVLIAASIVVAVDRIIKYRASSSTIVAMSTGYGAASNVEMIAIGKSEAIQV